MMIKDKDLGTHFIENYELCDYIGEGSNSKVYKVKRITDGKYFALKYLQRFRTKEWNEKQKNRFKNEIQALEKLSKLKSLNVIKLIDYNITDDGIYWYIMPIGETISKFFNDNRITTLKRIYYFIEIAKGLKGIHDLSYYHRDIKPNNILIIDKKIKLADFGLVWHPSFDPLTNKNEKVGPMETIAPEMREDDPDLKHSGKADIYSFVKTIWMLLLNRSRAFADQYSYETIDYLECNMDMVGCEEIKTFARLNELIMKGTEYIPINRPSIELVIKELELFLSDNQLPDEEIAKINESERIKRSLYLIKSDIESYTEFSKIKNFLDDIIKNSIYSICTELSDESYEIKFKANKIQASDIENGIIFLNSSLNKRYLLKVNKLEIEKDSNRIRITSGKIKLEDLPLSSIYEYKDFYSTSIMDRLLGDFEEHNEKSIVKIISKSETFVLKMA